MTIRSRSTTGTISYEPDAKSLLDGLLVRYVESQVYQAVVENNACEQAARMIAMKNATDNAGELISDLQLIYNKASGGDHPGNPGNRRRRCRGVRTGSKFRGTRHE